MSANTTPREDPLDVEDLAAEYLARTEAGEKPSESEYVGKLSAEDCETFMELVRGAQGAQARLPRPLGPGDVLGGRYKIVEHLDAGGMGQVFTAMDRELERMVALKVLLPQSLGDPEREEMLRDESRHLASLNHPGIVTVYDVGNDEEALFVAMELVDGRDLDSVLAEAGRRLSETRSDATVYPVRGALLADCIDLETPAGRPDLIDPSSWYRTAATIMVEIARTIEVAHQNGVVHRDLKPKNIMLQGGGAPVVLDFGLAGRREVKVGKVTQGFYGSVPYVTPEQARSYQVGSDARSDVYQLGLVLYEMLTLRRTFPGNSLPSILLQVKEGRFVRPRAVNPNAPLELEAICLKAMELSIENRYQTAREMREDLERYSAGLAPLALKGHNVRRVARQARFVLRRRAVWLAAAVAVVALVVGMWGVNESERWDDTYVFKRIIPGKGDPADLIEGAPVSPDESIALVVKSNHATTLYALSVFGGQSFDEQYIAPVQTATGQEMATEEDLEAGSIGLPLRRGSNLVFCSTIESDDHEMEGVLAINSRDENGYVEEWLAKLDEVAESRYPDEGGVPYLEAMQMFDNLQSTTRGGSPRKLSREERDSLVGNLGSDVLSGKVELKAEGLRIYRINCVVVSNEDEG